jgi:guanine nucleotide-binding protein G(i) subunit alpha
MGNCCGSSLSDEERAAYAETQTLDQLISRDQMRDSREVKLLLLGTGDSGKSTIFKQMQVLYGGGGFSRAQRDQFRVVVRQNIVQALFSLVQAVRRFQVSAVPYCAHATLG